MAVRTIRERKSDRELDPPRTAELPNQLCMVIAEGCDHSTGHLDCQPIGGGLGASVQRDESTKENGAEQAITGVPIGFPVDQHLTAPQPRDRGGALAA
jgi:hypothetical protein